MLDTIRGLYTCVRILATIVYERIRYACGCSDPRDYPTTIMHKLAKHNIIFTKVIQCLSVCQTFTKGMSPEIIAGMLDFVDNVPYTPDEIDYCQLLQTVNTYNIQLDDIAPIHSGMISLVYTGIMRDTNTAIVIKTARRNITARITDGVRVLRYLYNFLYVVLYPFKSHADLRLIESLITKTDYLLQQCTFDTEIKTLLNTRKIFAPICDIVIPRVYNHSDDTACIVMDRLIGCRITDVSEDLRPAYAHCVMTYLVWSIVAGSSMHIDLHTGNLICMQVDGRPVMGIIDFGITCVMNEDIKNVLIDAISLTCRLTNKRRNIKHVQKLTNNIISPEICYSALSEQDCDEVNRLLELYLDSVLLGKFGDELLQNLLQQLKCITGRVYTINPTVCRIFMGMTICNKIILYCIGHDKTRYMAMLAELLVSLSGQASTQAF